MKMDKAFRVFQIVFGDETIKFFMETTEGKVYNLTWNNNIVPQHVQRIQASKVTVDDTPLVPSDWAHIIKDGVDIFDYVFIPAHNSFFLSFLPQIDIQKGLDNGYFEDMQ